MQPSVAKAQGSRHRVMQTKRKITKVTVLISDTYKPKYNYVADPNPHSLPKHLERFYSRDSLK